MWFQVDKEASLDVMRGLLAQLKDENDVLTDEGVNLFNKNIVDSHNLRVVEMILWYDEDADEASKDPKDQEENMRNTIADEEYNVSDCIEIYYGSEIVNDQIELHAYLHETSDDCDETYTTFIYSPQYKTWIAEGFWDPSECSLGADVMILDFSAYFGDTQVPRQQGGVFSGAVRRFI